jgi:hypothetical protein
LRRFLETPRALVGLGAALSIASLSLYGYTADEEPFFTFHWAEALAAYGGPPVLAVGFGFWAVSAARAIRRRAVRSPYPGLAFVVLWTALQLFLLFDITRGYHGDMYSPYYGPLRDGQR